MYLDTDMDTDTDTDESGRQLRELDYDFGQGKDGLIRKKKSETERKFVSAARMPYCLSFCTFYVLIVF